MADAERATAQGGWGGRRGRGGTMQHHARPHHGDFGAGLLVLVQSVLQQLHVVLPANTAANNLQTGPANTQHL